jgi:hypothetical protein
MVHSYRPDDPLYFDGKYYRQWHFLNIGGLGSAGKDTAGIERVWADYRGNGVNVGVWDSGVERKHVDLDDNYNAALQPVGSDWKPAGVSAYHGTAVAGLIAGENNGIGGVGVSFEASITGVRIFDTSNPAWSSLKAFDVTNHSWGYNGGGNYARSELSAWKTSVETGRGGLGTINMKAAGNSQVNSQGEADNASRYTITVTGTTAGGRRPGITAPTF